MKPELRKNWLFWNTYMTKNFEEYIRMFYPNMIGSKLFLPPKDSRLGQLGEAFICLNECVFHELIIKADKEWYL